MEHCLEYARPYIDDIIIFSLDWESHLQHVASVLKALKIANLTANPLKCEWGGRQILYLGHVVGDGRLAQGRIQGGVMGVATPPFGLGHDHFISSAAASIAKDKSC